MHVTGTRALLENGKSVRLENEIQVKTGGYVRIVGNSIVDALSKKEGDSIRQLIAELNTNYDK